MSEVNDTDDLLFLLSDDSTDESPAPAPITPPVVPRTVTPPRRIAAPITPPPTPRKPSDEKWRKPTAPRISLEDCVNGTGSMQRMRPGEIAGKSVGKSGAPKRNPSLMGFGKYATRLIADIAEEDPAYLSWCLRDDIQGMRAKCEALGITEEDL